MSQLDFPRPQKHSPDWGIIILTGVVGLLVVIFAGILITQVSHAFETITTDTPPESKVSPSEPVAAYALEVQHRGEWTMRITVIKPGVREPLYYESSGDGVDVVLPTYETAEDDLVTVESKFTVYITYPVFDGTGRTQTGTRQYLSHGDYIDAMNGRHYMLYDENNTYLFIRDLKEMREKYNDVPISVWQP